MFIPRYLQESKSIWWKKALGWAEDWKWRNRMVVVDELLFHLRIKILFCEHVPNKSKIPFSFMFEIVFLILSNTDTRWCLLEPWASFMSNVIGSIWRNLKKKRKCISSLSRFQYRISTSKWLCGNWRHSPRPTRVAFSRCCVRCNSWRGKNWKKPLHTLQKLEETQFHCD